MDEISGGAGRDRWTDPTANHSHHVLFATEAVEGRFPSQELPENHAEAVNVHLLVVWPPQRYLRGHVGQGAHSAGHQVFIGGLGASSHAGGQSEVDQL